MICNLRHILYTRFVDMLSLSWLLNGILLRVRPSLNFANSKFTAAKNGPPIFLHEFLLCSETALSISWESLWVFDRGLVQTIRDHTTVVIYHIIVVGYFDNGQRFRPAVSIYNKRLHLDLLVKVFGDRLISHFLFSPFCRRIVLVRKSFRYDSHLSLHLSNLLIDISEVVQGVLSLWWNTNQVAVLSWWL